MMKYNAVLFDLDGTLVDSAPGIYATMQATFEHYGVHKTREQIGKYLGPPLRVTMAENVPQDEIENAVKIYRDIYENDGAFNAAVYGGVQEMLDLLKAAGCTICLATSKTKTVAHTVLEHFGLDKYFDYIGGASEDASIDTKTAVIESVLAQPCMCGKTAVMIGDRADDMTGAKNCSLPAVGALYGYGSKEELAPFNPVFMAASPLEIASFITLEDRYN